MYQDVIELITPTAPEMLGCYLAPQTAGATNPNITYVSQIDEENRKQIVYCKGFVTKNGAILGDPAQATTANPIIGFGPWDWMVATPSWIRQKLTENFWTNLNTGKLESVAGDGVRRLPRWIIYDEFGDGFCKFQWTMDRPETDYLIIGLTPSGQSYPAITKNTDSGVRCTFSGPYMVPALYDLPAGEDWVEEYEWGGQLNTNGEMIYSVKETICHRRGYGRYQWSAAKSDGAGGYLSPSSISEQTKIVKLPSNVVGLTPLQYVF